MRKTTGTAVILIAAVMAVFAVSAQEPRERVARVSVAEGEMSYQRGDDAEWTALGANTPLMTGDSLYAAQDGRAEVDLGDGTAVRLDRGTALDIVNLSQEVTQLGLTQGTANLRVRDIPSNGSVEMDTPLAAASIWEPGLYRVGLNGDEASFGVVSGSLSVVLNGEQLDVKAGETLEIRGGDNPTYGYSRLSSGSDFDRWSDGRDSRRQRSVSSQYVNDSVMGYDDLDDSGDWRQDRTYGNMWNPSRVSRDWAPYRTGRWMWQDPYGWTWISYEPWGWAPYHYGRWVYVGNSWGWIPPPRRGYRGPRAVMNIQPYYSPSLVVFLGGDNWSIGVSIGGGGGGHVGWFPLGPSDPYSYPWQPPVQVTNITYQNIYIDNSVTVVNYNNFRNGPVEHIRVDRDHLHRAPFMGHDAVNILPDRDSLHPYPDAKFQPRAGAGRERSLVALRMPPPKAVPFDTKIKEIEKSGKPYARPVAGDASVGKPFQPGMKAPDDVKVRPALGPDRGDPQPRLKPIPGKDTRTSLPVEHDAIKPDEGRKAEPLKREPQPSVRPDGRKAEPPKKELQPADRPDNRKAEPPKKELQPADRPDNRKAEPPKRELQPADRPDNRKAEPPKRELQPADRPDNRKAEPPKRELQPADRPDDRKAEPPKKELQPADRPDNRKAEPPKKELQPAVRPDDRQPAQPRNEEQARPPVQPPAEAPALTPEEKKAEEKRKAEEKKRAEEHGR